MQLTTSNFLEQVKNNLPDCIQTARGPQRCLDPSQDSKIHTIIDGFLNKNPQFGHCSSLNDSKFNFKCLSNDNSADYLILDTNPLGFGMGLYNDKKDFVNEMNSRIKWAGEKVYCTASFQAGNSAYQCEGNLPNIDRASYSMQVDFNGNCRDIYSPDPLKGGYVLSNCKNDLPLFDQFLSHSPFEEASLLSRMATYLKLSSGSIATIYFGCKTAVKINELWKNQHSGLIEKSGSLKKQALVYGTAAIISALFTGITYLTDVSEAYQTGSGQYAYFNP